MANDNDDDYKVGFGKPPQHTRFAKGKSGNPNGRPKGSKNFATLVLEIGDELIPLMEGGKQKLMPRKRVVLRQAYDQACKGDPRARRDVLQLLRASDLAESSDLDVSARDQIEMQLMLNHAARQAKSRKVDEPSEKPKRPSNIIPE